MRLRILLFALAGAVGPAAAQFPPTHLQNIKALPADIPVAALVDTMKGFTRALGVRCTYCHVGREDQDLSQYDFSSDQRPTKEKARAMIRMVDAINANYLASLPNRSNPPVIVNCVTCHHGVALPQTIDQLLIIAYQRSGIDSSIALYRALRARYYGRAVYDFGEVPLSDVADAADAMGKHQDAIRFNQVNTELLPASGFAFRQLGFSYLATGDTADAIAAWTKRLELTPNNPEAKQLLNSLTAKPPR